MKKYHVKTREDYDALMIELDRQGYKWNAGSKMQDFDGFIKYKEKTTIKTKKNKRVTFGNLDEKDDEDGVIEYKVKGDTKMPGKECAKCHEKRSKKAIYCQICGSKLVDEPEFRVGDIIASKIFADGSFSLVRLNEDLTNHLTSVDGFWYTKRDCDIDEASFGVFKEDTRHATPEEIAEYEVALTFHKHGREPFEVKKGDLIRTPSEKNTLICYPENYTKEEFLNYGWEFLKTVEEVNEWLGADDE